MSGAGRKTHYRKSVTDEFLYGDAAPAEGERLARVVRSRGSNLFEIELKATDATAPATLAAVEEGAKASDEGGEQPEMRAKSPSTDADANATGSDAAEAEEAAETVLSLAILPTKFRKLIWVKRDDFVFVSEAEGAVTNTTGKEGRVRHMIQRIPRAEDRRQLQALWSGRDAEEQEGGKETGEAEAEAAASNEEEAPAAATTPAAAGANNLYNDDEDEDKEEDDDPLFRNPNVRKNALYIVDDSDDEEEEEEEDDDGDDNVR